jgi:hypothetical protein
MNVPKNCIRNTFCNSAENISNGRNFEVMADKFNTDKIISVHKN